MRVLPIKIRHELLSYTTYRELFDYDSSRVPEFSLSAFNLLVSNYQPSSQIPRHFGFTNQITSLNELRFEYHILDYVTNRKPLTDDKIVKGGITKDSDGIPSHFYMADYNKQALVDSKNSYKYISMIHLSQYSLTIQYYLE
jgi:hypothetical protein